jgi:hypothetical protein
MSLGISDVFGNLDSFLMDGLALLRHANQPPVL